MAYQPSQKVLENYANVLVNFALGGGKGIKKGDVVVINTSEPAKPLLFAVRRAVLKAGGHPILWYHPAEDDRYSFSRDFFEHAQDHQLDFFPGKYLKGLVDEMDHLLFILATENPHDLKGIDPKKIMRRGESLKPFMEWRTHKEHQGKFTWCIALWGTAGMAKEAGLSQREYWKQIEKACFLNDTNPIKTWNQVYRQIHAFTKKLNALSPKIDHLRVEGEDADLRVRLGEKRKWLSGSGRNVPSFEIFTSPDWRGTEGWIRFNQPLYRYGNKITGIELHFREGRVVKATARQNEKVLKEMIRTPGADKIGEFSLTDGRHSHITKFMANTLYDENAGGRQGNTHIAVGQSYADTYVGDVSKLSKKDKERLGFNASSVHTDIISTTKRRVTAVLKNGKEIVIYDDGKFTL